MASTVQIYTTMLDLLGGVFYLLCHCLLGHRFLASAEVICGHTDYFKISCPEGYVCCGEFGEHCCKDEAYLGKEYIENDIRRKIDEKRLEEIARLGLMLNRTDDEVADEDGENMPEDETILINSSLMFVELLFFRSTEIFCLVAIFVILGIFCKHFFFGGVKPFVFKKTDAPVTCYRLLPDNKTNSPLSRQDAAVSANSGSLDLIWTTEINENINYQITEYRKWFAERESLAAKPM